MTTQPPSFGRRANHRLYRVIGDGRSAIWTPIGAAWPNKDGMGFNVSCDLVPLQGRIVMRAVNRRGRRRSRWGSAMTPTPSPCWTGQGLTMQPPRVRGPGGILGGYALELACQNYPGCSTSRAHKI